MACSSCGGGRVRFDSVPRATVRAQPSFPNVRLNSGSTGGAKASNPNTPLPSTPPKRTQV